jgi:hypothetical protein
MIKPVIPTRGNDLYPMAKHCRMNSLPSNGREKSSLKNLPMNTEASPAPSRLRCRVMFKIDSLTGSSEKQGAASRSWTRKNQGQLCFGKKIVDNNIRCMQNVRNAAK